MTVDEFKKYNPELVHLEGDELWNAMEDSILSNENSNTIVTFYNPPPIVSFEEKDLFKDFAHYQQHPNTKL